MTNKITHYFRNKISTSGKVIILLFILILLYLIFIQK